MDEVERVRGKVVGRLVEGEIREGKVGTVAPRAPKLKRIAGTVVEVVGRGEESRSLRQRLEC